MPEGASRTREASSRCSWRGIFTPVPHDCDQHLQLPRPLSFGSSPSTAPPRHLHHRFGRPDWGTPTSSVAASPSRCPRARKSCSASYGSGGPPGVLVLRADGARCSVVAFYWGTGDEVAVRRRVILVGGCGWCFPSFRREEDLQDQALLVDLYDTV